MLQKAPMSKASMINAKLLRQKPAIKGCVSGDTSFSIVLSKIMTHAVIKLLVLMLKVISD